MNVPAHGWYVFNTKQMNNVIIESSYVTELTVAAASTVQTIPFGDIGILKGKKLQSISTYAVANMAVSPNKVALANQLLLQSSFLNLFVGPDRKIWNIPLIDLVTARNTAGAGVFVPFAYEFNNLEITWENSYIFIANTATIAAGQAEVFLMNIKFTK